MNVHRVDGMSRSRPALAAAVLSALILGACQAVPPTSTVGPTAGPTQSAAATATAATATASAAASRSPGATGIAALEVTGTTGELAPGRYTRQGFEPRITFELDGPWHSVNAAQGFFDVQQDVGSSDVIAVQFGLPDRVAKGPLEGVAITTAEAAAATLASNSRLVTVESSSSRIGGLTGFQITVENSPDRTDLTPVIRVTPGVLQIAPGRRLWCAFFDTPNGVLAILVGGSVVKWDQALAAAEPVVESVTIGQ